MPSEDAHGDDSFSGSPNEVGRRKKPSPLRFVRSDREPRLAISEQAAMGASRCGGPGSDAHAAYGKEPRVFSDP